ncbi:hypothetical protein LCGC14_1507730 [marine sediment metagenome]|uniref:Uncharacterized protein n=1 Tax=marine sediment metagenome TaxID=412755 RepID=A0A0F9JN26_9ZZZZ
MDEESKGIPVRVENLVEVVGDVFTTPQMDIPGIATASAYTTADAFGVKFSLEVPPKGVISTAVFLDKDAEGINKELVVFRGDFVVTADHDAFAPSDGDLENIVGIIEWETWYSYSLNQVGIAYPALYYTAPQGKLFFQFVTRGADNIAAAAVPRFFLVIT